MLKVAGLNVSIGPIPIIRNVSLDVGEGEMCGLIGRNGAGKTTHHARVDGRAAGERHGDARRCRSAGAARAPPRRITASATCRRTAGWCRSSPSRRTSGCRAGPRASTTSTQRLKWIFSIMPEVEKFRSRRALELSGGQQKMVALARALMAGRRILLLDEPFEGLAPALARRLGEVLANLKSQGVSVLIAESNEVHVADLLSRAFRIERGAVAPV